ncbi:MAG: N-sulfoglucosamine sulfohydrolase [Chloroflexi bacterium]|nr:MAG: N-sulfoglucosamine sulfohydrolase [Chloroflexota bacterium]
MSYQEKPNIIMIHGHDMGRHFGCYGRGLETPNIDSLAADGVMFTNHFGAAPYCAPSRSSRITGMYPCNHGAMGQTIFGWSIRDGVKTLPMCMNDAGYDTRLFGHHHENPNDPAALGYQHVEHASHVQPCGAKDVTPKVIDFLDDFDVDKDKPFYIDVGFWEAHVITGGADRLEQGLPPGSLFKLPNETYSREYTPDEVNVPPHFPDVPGVRQDLADIHTIITSVVDTAVGRILDKLRETGLENDTLVIFTTDHGIDMIPLAKGTLYDSGTEVALLMRYPKSFPKGKVFDQLLSNVDLLPTLAELAGADSPEDIDGRSFLPLIEGKSYTPRECIFTENTWHGQYKPMRAIRTERFKLIRNFHPAFTFYLHRPLYQEPRVLQKGMGLLPIEELYDLQKDPYEQNNLASTMNFGSYYTDLTGGHAPSNPEYSDILHELRKQLKNHMEETNDPLLKGPVPHPAYKHLWDGVE